MVNDVRTNYQGLTVETLKSGRKRIRVRVEGFPNRKVRLHVNIDHPKFSEHYWNARGHQTGGGTGNACDSSIHPVAD